MTGQYRIHPVTDPPKVDGGVIDPGFGREKKTN